MDRTLVDWEECDRLDTLFVLLCSVACWAVIAAIGMAYSGYSIRRNGLASIFPSLLALLVCTIQWYLIGYSLAFSEGNGFIGGLSKSFHIGVGAAPVGTIPEVLFSIFQLLFCATVCAISVGGSVERGRLLPLIPYIFLWCTFIYCPLAHMVWSEYGYLSKLGVMDFAGGTPVHICSGFSATAIAVYLSNPLFRSKKSSKRTPSHIKLHKPNNISNMLFSMVFIWNCWLPFESGTALAFNFKAVQAFAVTQFAAASGSLTWTALNYIETRKFSIDAAMLGMLSGLVMITPAGGFVSLTDALLLGSIGVLVIHTALRFKSTSKAEGMKWVDPADVAATHAFGGIFATLLVGVFGQKKIAAYDGTDILGGVLHDGHWDQLRIQLVEGLIGATLSFVLSYVFIAAIDCVPGLEVLCTDEELLDGMDASQCIESLYGEHAKDEEDYQPISVQAVRLD